jgi:predicted secreted protein
MAAIKGDGGVIKFGTSGSEATVALVAGWSLDITSDTIDVTTMGTDNYRDFVAGKYSWSGSCEMHWDAGDDTAQEAMETSLLALDNTKKLLLYPGGTTGVDRWEGFIIVTGVSISGSIGDSVKYNASFQGTGVLDHVNA